TAEAVGYDLTVALDDAPAPLSGIERYAGADRYGTSVEISRRTFPEGGCDAVVIASGKGFADALSGSGLAGAVGGPLLLTDPAALSIGAWEEISRLGATKAFIVGGTGAVSDDVYVDLDLGGIEVTRVAGATRYDTAVAVADRMNAPDLLDGAVTEAVVVYGGNFPDALAASPVAYAQGMPVLLTPKDALGASARAFLAANCSQAYVIGGAGAVSEAAYSQVASATGSAERIAGADRYLTARMVGECFSGTGNGFGFVGIAKGTDFPDALSGGAATGYERGVLLLTPAAPLGDAALGAIRDDMVWGDDAAVFGGESAVSVAAFATAAEEIGLKEP
ncbi:MAG: cell wall-binding repeat-containing protein, partial [Actinobacteria bacterium]